MPLLSPAAGTIGVALLSRFLALDPHRRQTGTMSGYVSQELAPVTTCSAG